MTCYNIYDWISIEAHGTNQLQKFFGYFQRDSVKEPDIIINVGHVDIDIGKKYYNMDRFLLAEREIIERRRFGTLRLKDLLGKTKLCATKGYVRFRPFTNLIRDLLWYKMINMGKNLLHSACLSSSGEGYLILAWRGMGKTMSTINLMRTHNFQFLSDDLTIIDKDGDVYAFPLPLKLSLPHAKVLGLGKRTQTKLFLGQLIEKIPIIRNRVEIAHYAGIKDIIVNAVVIEKAKLGKIILLRHFPNENEGLYPMDKQYVIKSLILQNRLERAFWNERLFVPYSFSDDEFDPKLIEDEEANIITNALRNVECYELRFKKYPTEQLKKLAQIA